MTSTKSARAGGYAAAIVICGAVLCVKLATDPLVFPGPFSLFLPGVLVAAWLGGVGPGLFATALSAVMAALVLVPDLPHPGGSGWVNGLRAGLFLLTGAAVSGIVRSLRTAKQRVVETEERSRTLVESVVDYAMFLVDSRGNVLTWNIGGERLYGWRAADIIGDSFLRVWPGAELHAGRGEALLAEAARAGKATAETELLRSDGSRFWAQVLVSPARDGRGQVTGYSVITHDITERRRTQAALQAAHDQLEARVAARTDDLALANRRLGAEVAVRRAAEAELRASEERFAVTLEHSPSGLALVRLTDRPGLAWANRTFRDLVGFEDAELFERPFSDIIYSADREAALVDLQRLLAGETHGYHAERRVVHRSGRVFWAQVNVALVRADDGTPRYLISQLQDISARKQAEEELRASRERLALAVAGANDGLWDWDVRENRLFVSGRTREIVGLPAVDAEMSLADFVDRLHMEDLPRVRAAILAHFSGAVAHYECEHRLRHEDGQFRWVFARGLAVRDPTDRAVRLAAVMSDITARKEAEIALRTSEAHYRELITSVSDGLVTVDAGGIITHVNPSVETLSGYHATELCGQHFLEFIHAEDRPVAQAQFENACAGMTTTVEYRGVTRGGAVRWLQSTGRPLTAEDGSAGMRAMMLDLTEQRLIAAAVAEREERFRALLAHSSVVVLLVDAAGRIQFVGPSASPLLGYEPDEMVGLDSLDLVEAEDREQVRVGFARVLETPGHTETIVHRVRSRAGDRRWVEVVATNCVDAAAVGGVVVNVRDVTERQTSEAALRASEEKYRDLVENINDVLFTFDCEGVFTYISSVVTQLTGHAVDEVVGRHFSEFVLPEYLPALAEDLAGILAGRGTQPAAFEIRTTAGPALWVSSFSRPIIVDGTIVGLRGMFSDITARKQAEEGLRQRTAELEAIFQVVPDLFFRMDREGRIADFRAGDPVQLYTPPERFLGKRFAEVLPDPAATLIGALVDEAARIRRPGVGEYPLELHGEVRTFEARVWPFLDHEVITMVRDVTERSAAEKGLRESEAKFRSLAESTGATIFIQRDERLLYVNPAAEVLTGYPLAELMAGNFWDLLDPRFRQQARTRNGLRLEGKNVPARALVKIVRRDGAARWVDFSATRIAFAGRPAVLGTAIDVTERKTAEREARQRQAELAHVLRVGTMGEMAASLAHELNQPLQAVVNFATGCLRRLNQTNGTATDLADPLNQIAAEALRAGEIVRRIRQFVRKAPARREWADVNELVLEATRIFEPEAALDAVAVRVGVLPDLPPVYVDPIQIEQVILNLLRNGLEAMATDQAAERILRVETSVCETDAVRVRVRDSGRGFAPELTERLFEPFYTTKPQGLGMGLSISRSIIEAHGGRLFAASRPGAGAEVGFTLIANDQGATYAA